MEQAKPVLLEPVMDVEVHTPDENSGDVMGEITSRRGRPMGMEAGSKGYQVVKATVPYSEMLDFSNQLSSITSGKGYFTMKFANYSEVPANEQDKIIAARKKELEEKE
jgi:elongation factor G